MYSSTLLTNNYDTIHRPLQTWDTCLCHCVKATSNKHCYSTSVSENYTASSTWATCFWHSVKYSSVSLQKFNASVKCWLNLAVVNSYHFKYLPIFVVHLKQPTLQTIYLKATKLKIYIANYPFGTTLQKSNFLLVILEMLWYLYIDIFISIDVVALSKTYVPYNYFTKTVHTSAT